jgi:hypothetical protein
LRVLDLLEDLAHPRPEQVALLGRRRAVTSPRTLAFARVQTLVVAHHRIVLGSSRPRQPG